MENEERWVEQLKLGDIQAFQKLYEKYHAKVYTTAFGMLGNEADAEDAVQEIFMKIYHKVATFDSRSNIGTWLYRIAVNFCIDLKRRSTVSRSKSLSVEETLLNNLHDSRVEPEKTVISSEVQQLVRKAITHLSPKLRSVIVLRDLQGMTHMEIAEILGCSKGTVSSRLNRGRRKLRALIILAGLDDTYRSELT